jgi:predicted transcriptional regulator
MSLSLHTVLVELVELADDTGEPVGEATLAAALAVPSPELAGPLDSLAAFDLVAETGEGYRPTVTARELLAADIELDDALVLDTVEG